MSFNINELFSVTGKTAIVTGGSRGMASKPISLLVRQTLVRLLRRNCRSTEPVSQYLLICLLTRGEMRSWARSERRKVKLIFW